MQQNAFSNLFNASGCWEAGERVVATVFLPKLPHYRLNYQHICIPRHGLMRAGDICSPLTFFSAHLLVLYPVLHAKKSNRKVHATCMYSPALVQTLPRQQCHPLAWTREHWVAGNKMKLCFILNSQSLRPLCWKWFGSLRSLGTTEAIIAMVSKCRTLFQVVPQPLPKCCFHFEPLCGHLCVVSLSNSRMSLRTMISSWHSSIKPHISPPNISTWPTLLQKYL